MGKKSDELWYDNQSSFYLYRIVFNYLYLIIPLKLDL